MHVPEKDADVSMQPMSEKKNLDIANSLFYVWSFILVHLVFECIIMLGVVCVWRINRDSSVQYNLIC